MDHRSSLGDFLQTRRGQISPDDVGLTRPGDRRRVPGLRREELAMLAGVSAGYYTRLEQGQSLNASKEVLDAIASAMKLSPAERAHLHVLSDSTRRRIASAPPPPEHASRDLCVLLEAMGAVPALILGRCNDVLAWNKAGHALLAGHLEFTGPADPTNRPNMSRMAFLDAHTRDLYRDWPRKARAVAGNLRIMTGRHPGDADLAALIGELAITSPEFAQMWTEHTIEACDRDVHDLQHPLVGELTIIQQTLQIPSSPHQSLIAITTEPQSPSATALALLAHMTSSSRE